MKKIIFFITLLTLSINLLGQQTTPLSQPTSQDYLKKSKNQKTAAWILLGSGAVMLAIAAPGNVSFDILPILAVGGTLSVLGSIPLFIASGKNKRRAMKASAYFEMQKDPFTMVTGQACQPNPAFSLKIKF